MLRMCSFTRAAYCESEARCGYAAPQCGKAPPYRWGFSNSSRLRLEPEGGIAQNINRPPAVRHSLTALESAQPQESVITGRLAVSQAVAADGASLKPALRPQFAKLLA